MGVDAAGSGSESWCGCLESAGLGEAHRENSPRSTDSGRHPGTKPSQQEAGPSISEEYLYNVVDVLDEVAAETGKTVPEISLNWLLQRPTVSTLIIGARNEAQRRDSLGAIGWNLSADQVAKLDAVSTVNVPYPYWHQRTHFASRNPLPTP